jgi:dinuclear metal center YbgI/SA1388 family protein
VLISTLTTALDQLADPRLAEGYDNVGLLVGDYHATCTGVLCTLDVTLAVLYEAAEKNCNLIVAHHPAWFGSRLNLRPEGFAGHVLYQAARRGLHLYACHTNLDHVAWGVNKYLAEKLGLSDLRILEPRGDTRFLPATDYGSGMLGQLAAPIPKLAFIAHVAQALGAKGIRYADTVLEEVHTIAVCGGSGSFLIDAARAAGADALVTADVTYHKFFEPEGRMLLLDVGHYESEAHVPAILHAHLKGIFPTFALHLSATHTNPVLYHPFGA